MSVTHHAAQHVLFLAECLVDSVYGIKMKWEPATDTMVDWCECRICFRGPPVLMKGVQFQHPASPLHDFCLWDRWVDHFSPNIAVVLRSMVPNLVHKAPILASTELCRQINLAALVRGFCFKRYAKAWWWSPSGRR